MKKHAESRLTRLRNLTASDNGFTLIEVLAVMVIVGLLAAIAIPQIGKFRERAYVTSLKSDARTLVNEAEGVYVDTGEYPVNAAALTDGVDLSPHNAVVDGSYSSNENGVTFKIHNSKANKTVQVTNNRLDGVGTPEPDEEVVAGPTCHAGTPTSVVAKKTKVYGDQVRPEAQVFFADGTTAQYTWKWTVWIDRTNNGSLSTLTAPTESLPAGSTESSMKGGAGALSSGYANGTIKGVQVHGEQLGAHGWSKIPGFSPLSTRGVTSPEHCVFWFPL